MNPLGLPVDQTNGDPTRVLFTCDHASMDPPVRQAIQDPEFVALKFHASDSGTRLLTAHDSSVVNLSALPSA